MPTIRPIRDLKNTSEISELAHSQQEPIFITKNGYSDLVVMSAELFEHFAAINKTDDAITHAEEEYEKTHKTIDAKDAFDRLEKKYFG
ncbi:MAG: type II toxin-antitoxin system Phd/YefM family antitoxin [Lachnospiraceae bacterium]|nr:type II toxin-antitoxin system Phd/YefM family antitoxin [Lachnospiraceae bacterium]